MSEHKSPIPSRIYNASVGGHICGTEDIIDDTKNKTQKQINSEVEESLGTGGSVDSRIASAVATETSRAQTAEEQLRQAYEALSQSQPIPVTSLPATGEAGKIYRLAGTTSYADYMYAEGALTTPIKMAEYDNAIDDEPTAGSDNLVKSGGVYPLKSKQKYYEGNVIEISLISGEHITGTVGGGLYWASNKVLPTNSFLNTIEVKSATTSTITICFIDVEDLSVNIVGTYNVITGNNIINICKGTKKPAYVGFMGALYYDNNSGEGYSISSYTVSNNVAVLQETLSGFGIDAKINYVILNEEVVDARRGYDDVVYPTLGDAIRSQISSTIDVVKNYRQINKIDFGWTDGGYYSWGDGAYSINPDYCYSKLFDVKDFTYILLSGNAGGVNPVCFYDSNGVFISGAYLPSQYSIPSNAKFVRFSIPITVKTTYYVNFLNIKNNTIYVGKDELFKTINSALSFAYTFESRNNPWTIYITPGIYKEVLFVQGTHYVSLIGTNRDDCIIMDCTALYNNAPLRIQGQCYVANLSIITNADEYVSEVTGNTGFSAWKTDVLNGVADPEWLGTIGSYAVHCDDVTNGENTVSRFENCYMYSCTMPAFGAGMQLNNRIELVNCELVCDIDFDLVNLSNANTQGAILVHGVGGEAVAEPNQSLFMKGCYISAINCKCLNMYMQAVNPKADLMFLNNIFNNNRSLSLENLISFNFDTQYINKCSYGNNISFFNKQLVIN